jgi:class 3 adenylate cyclase
VAEPSPAPAPRSEVPLRPWQRLSVRLAAVFVAVTLLAVGLVGFLAHERQKREVEDTVGAQLMNIARTAVLLVDPAAHTWVQHNRRADADAYRRVHRALAAVQREVLLTSPIRTLADFDAARGQARLMVTSAEDGRPGEPYTLAPEVIQTLAWTFEDGVARFTGVYRNARGVWISAFAPIPDATGATQAVLVVDYPVEIYLDRLRELRTSLVQAAVAGILGALVVGLLFARRLTRPISALTRGVARVAAGDLSQALPVRSHDEVGRLTRAFNGMLEGLRQRDFIRATFGRYVSPEVAKTLLESPEGLNLGGEKREVTILMSDLRGYTRFAEQGDPAWVMEVLNGYLARMTDIVIEHGGTINEFIGDAIFAVYNAPLAQPDHAERAAATALAMQNAMVEINEAHAARGLPRFEMGIGINTGEAVVGNIGSEQRAKYSVVGAAVNLASRVEGATVGGQVFLSEATWERIREVAEVAAPVSVEVKGVVQPLALYELTGLRGRFARRLEDPGADADPAAEVALPLSCWVIDGKVIRKERLAGTLVRLGPRQIDAHLEASVPPLTNLRLRLTLPALGKDSGDLYGKVMREEARDGVRLTRIRLTSVDPDDRMLLARLMEPGAPVGA